MMSIVCPTVRSGNACTILNIFKRHNLKSVYYVNYVTYSQFTQKWNVDSVNYDVAYRYTWAQIGSFSLLNKYVI